MTAFTDFLADAGRRRLTLLEVRGRNIATNAVQWFYFASGRFGTGPTDSLSSQRFDALITDGFALTESVQGEVGPLVGILPGRTGGTIRLGQQRGAFDTGTLGQFQGVSIQGWTFAGRTAIVRRGGYSPRLGRQLTYAEMQPLYLTVEGEPQVGVDDVTFILASPDKNFEFPVQDRAYGGFGYGLLFDGTNDYVDFGTDSAFDFTSGAFTIEFPWYFEANPGAERKILTRGSDAVDGWSVPLTASGEIGIRTNQSGASQTSRSSAVTIGRHGWVEITRSGATAKVYVDGVDVTSSAATHINPTTASRNLYLGRSDNGALFVNALIPELRIWNYVRSQEERGSTRGRPLTSAEVAAAGSTLLLYAKMNEGTGTTVDNTGSVGAAADGTISGATWVHSGTGHAGLIGQKLPDLWGPVRGWEPELIDPARSIYFLSSLPINDLLRVDVGGLQNMVAESATPSLFTLLTSTPATGKYRLCKTAGGTWLRLGSKPSRRLTVDVEGNAPGGTYLENAADQIRYIVCNRGLSPLTDPTSLDTTSFSDLETANPAPVGHGWKEDVSVAEVIGVPLRTVGAVAWFRTGTGLFAVERVEGVTAKSAVLAITQRDIFRGTFQPLAGGTPTATVNLKFQRNYAPLSPTDLLPGVAGTDREAFATREWQTVGQTDSAAKGDFKNAKTLEIETGFDDHDDALAEASRQLALYNSSDQPFVFLCRQRGVELDRMDAITIDYQDLDRIRRRQSRFGTGPAEKFLVLSTSPDDKRGGVWILAWREEI